MSGSLSDHFCFLANYFVVLSVVISNTNDGQNCKNKTKVVINLKEHAVA